MYGTQWECCGPLYAKKEVHSGNRVCIYSENHGTGTGTSPYAQDPTHVVLIAVLCYSCRILLCSIDLARSSTSTTVRAV